jgi:hypothetical protein
VIRAACRALVVLAGVTGLLALVPHAARAYILANHTEPQRRES